MADRKLSLLAYEIIPEEININYYKTYFPIEWYDSLIDIYKKIKARDKVTLPSISLNNALESLPLSISMIGKLIKREEIINKAWIISNEKLNSEILLRVIKSWISIEFINNTEIEDEFKNKIIEIVESFKVNDIRIVEEYLNLSDTKAFENGTANPNGDIYTILGCYMAKKISENQIPIKIGEDSLYFMKNKNSLISYPPKEYKGSYYSIYTSFTVKTIACYKSPIILIDSGIKRWANGPKANLLGWEINTGAFIKYNNDLLGSGRKGVSFGKEIIVRDKQEKKFKWANNVKEILEDTTLVYLPDIENVLENSAEYLNLNKEYSILISYNNYAKFNHPVKKGLSMMEQYQIYESIKNKFSFLKPVADNNYRKINGKIMSCEIKSKIKFPRYLDEIAINNKELIIEIMYINRSTPQKILDNFLLLINEFEIDGTFSDCDEVVIKYNNLTIKFKAIFSQGLTEQMDDFNLRVKEVEELMKPYKNQVLTLVEIKDKDYYKKKKDPKFAIRKGLYRCNRLNQFIISENINNKKEDVVKSIIKSSFLDLFRQFEVITGGISVKGLKGIPQDLEIVGFNLLSTNKSEKFDTLSLPVAVSMSVGKKEIYVKTPIFDDWMRYKDAILKLGSLNYNDKSKKYSKDEIKMFFTEILNDIKDENSLVIVDTSNRLNSVLQDFQDRNIKINKINNHFKNIRFIRVKSNIDVPNAVGLNDNGEAYYTSGVSEILDNIYYSLEGKTTTYTGIWQADRKYINPGKEFKIPGTLEIVTAKLNEEDNKDSFVYLVNSLRNMNITFDEWTSVPLVNHLAKSFQEVLEVRDVEVKEE